MLSAASSLASDLVRLIPAALVTLVGSARAGAALPPPIVALTIAPPPRSRIDGTTPRQKRTAPITLSWMSAIQASSSSASRPWAAEAPALLIRMSTPPNSAVTASMNRSTSPFDVTSAACAKTSPAPAARSSSAACSSGAARRAQIATRAPSPASRRAVASPIPSLPPVTIATLPSRPSSSMRSVLRVVRGNRECACHGPVCANRSASDGPSGRQSMLRMVTARGGVSTRTTDRRPSRRCCGTLSCSSSRRSSRESLPQRPERRPGCDRRAVRPFAASLP